MIPDKRSPRPVERQTGTETLTQQENRRPAPNGTSESAFGLVTCLDCTAATWGQRLVHDETCPAAGAMDRVQDDDAAWFKANPGATVRRRPITDAEIQEAETAGVARPTGPVEVEVVQLRPGLRSRQFIEVGDRR